MPPNNLSPQCGCVADDYNRQCPYAFEQGGSWFHCVGGEAFAIPCNDETESCQSWENDDPETGINEMLDDLYGRTSKSNIPPPPPPPIAMIEREIKMEPRVFKREKYIDDTSEIEYEQHPIIKNNTRKMDKQSVKKKEDTAEELMMGNRNSLKKFEALRINGTSINDYSIGGFKLNVAKTTAVVKKIAPLPPSALPKIFIDDDLNFYHHFFRGMESLLGTPLFFEIVNAKHHYDDGHGTLPNSVLGFMESGLDSGDNALTLLVKKVLSSTFEKSDVRQSNPGMVSLSVVSNLWGFRYIEPGMNMRDADIRMWLSSCHSHYKTVWFDTFKSSGVPEFATEGVVLAHAHPTLKLKKPRDNKEEIETAMVPYRAKQNIYERHENRNERKKTTRRSNTWFN